MKKLDFMKKALFIRLKDSLTEGIVLVAFTRQSLINKKKALLLLKKVYFH